MFSSKFIKIFKEVYNFISGRIHCSAGPHAARGLDSPVLEKQLDTDLKEKLNNVSSLEFYIKYLSRIKYKQILIHNFTFYKYVGMYLHIREAIFKYKIYEK